jgi:MYXO-CTERM domain-containing protein
MKKITLGLALVLVGTLTLASQARAQSSFIFTLEQDGSDVVGTGSGTINTTDLTLVGTGGGGTAAIWPALGVLVLYAPDASSEADYSGITGTSSSFGSGGYTEVSASSGDLVGLQEADVLYVPFGYTSGNQLSDSATWDGSTLSSLGVTPGTYEWTWGSGVNAGTLTLYAGTSPAPEPSTWALLLGGLGLLAFWRIQMRRA